MEPFAPSNRPPQGRQLTKADLRTLDELQHQCSALSHSLRCLMLKEGLTYAVQLSDLDIFIAANNGVSTQTNYITPELPGPLYHKRDRIAVTAHKTPVFFQHILHLQQLTGKVNAFADMAKLASATIAISRDSAARYVDLLQDTARHFADNRERYRTRVAELFALRAVMGFLDEQGPIGTRPALVRVESCKDTGIVTSSRATARHLLHPCQAGGYVFVGGAGINTLEDLPVLSSMLQYHFELNDVDPFVTDVFANVLRLRPTRNITFTHGPMSQALSRRTSIDLVIISDVSQPLSENHIDIAPAVSKALKPNGHVHVAQNDQRGRPGGVQFREWEGALELSGHKLVEASKSFLAPQPFAELERDGLLALSGKEILAAEETEGDIARPLISYRSALYSKQDHPFSNLSLPPVSAD